MFHTGNPRINAFSNKTVTKKFFFDKTVNIRRHILLLEWELQCLGLVLSQNIKTRKNAQNFYSRSAASLRLLFVVLVKGTFGYFFFD